MFYEWVTEGMTCPRWMGFAKWDFRTDRKLFVLIPFNFLIALYFYSYQFLRRGKPYMCKDCLGMKQRMFDERADYEKKRDELIEIIHGMRADRNIPWPKKP